MCAGVLTREGEHSCQNGRDMCGTQTGHTGHTFAPACAHMIDTQTARIIKCTHTRTHTSTHTLAPRNICVLASLQNFLQRIQLMVLERTGRVLAYTRDKRNTMMGAHGE